MGAGGKRGQDADTDGAEDSASSEDEASGLDCSLRARFVAELQAEATAVAWSPPQGGTNAGVGARGVCACLLAVLTSDRAVTVFRAPRPFSASAGLPEAPTEWQVHANVAEVLVAADNEALGAAGSAKGEAGARQRLALRSATAIAWSRALCTEGASLLAVGTEAGTIALLRHAGGAAEELHVAGCVCVGEAFVQALAWAQPDDGPALLVAADATGAVRAWAVSLESSKARAISFDGALWPSASVSVSASGSRQQGRHAARGRAAGALTATALASHPGWALVAASFGDRLLAWAVNGKCEKIEVCDARTPGEVTALLLASRSGGAFALHACTRQRWLWRAPLVGATGAPPRVDISDVHKSDLSNAPCMDQLERSSLKHMRVGTLTALAALPPDGDGRAALLAFGSPLLIKRVMVHNSQLSYGFAMPLSDSLRPLWKERKENK